MFLEDKNKGIEGRESSGYWGICKKWGKGDWESSGLL